jgi:hypothetical protein
VFGSAFLINAFPSPGDFFLNFRTVTEKLLVSFNEQNIRYALIGGYAVGLWGVARGTVDMDFLVLRDNLDDIDRIMDSLGYELRYRSENVSQYIAQRSIFGEIDFLHAFRAPSLRMLERAADKAVFGEGLPIKVLIPEDLIGLKIQAIANNENRAPVDLQDIELLVQLHGDKMDWQLIEEYCEIFDMMDLYEKLKGKYDAVQ